MELGLKGKVALVAAASRGLGRAVAQELAQEGADLILCARTAEPLIEAKAEIDGESVVVSADGVKQPVAVRFGWDQIAEPNLSNKDGLPASPFRTDR